ncbi:hypothetical protein JZO67_004318 [Enterococcus sp. 665A]|uniref:Uncharacterized protein n=1 Tax=Candidatus Enterococcus ferrettii TaxID=2815324 RepID=A0ABV0EUK8_9ENTE
MINKNVIDKAFIMDYDDLVIEKRFLFTCTINKNVKGENHG